MVDARENWQEAYRAAAYQIKLSHKNAIDIANQAYDDAKEQVTQTGDDLEDQLEETYRGTVNKINQINTEIQIPQLTRIWETGINRIYDFFEKFAQ